MKKIFTLERVLRKCGSGGEDVSQDMVKQVVILVVLALLIVPVFMAGKFFSSISLLLGGPGSVCGVLFFVCAVLMFVLSIPYFVGVYFMSEDVLLLFTMPFTALDVAVAKLGIRFKNCLLVSMVVILPFGVGMGYSLGEFAGVSYWIGLLLAWLLIPLTSTAFAALVSVVLMKVFKVARNKEALAFLGVAVFVAAMILRMVMPDQNLLAIDMSWLMTKGVWLVSVIGYVFPVGQLSANIMSGAAVSDVLLLAGAVIGYLLVFALVTNGWYRDVVLKMQDSSGAGRKLGAKGIAKASTSRSVLNALMWKDFKLLVRTPAYVLNSVIVPVLLPVIVCVAFVFGNGGAGAEVEGDADSAMMVAFGIILVITTFMSFINPTAHHSISREGSSFLYMKQMPVPYETQIKAKRRLALYLGLISCTPYIYVYEIVQMIQGDVSFLYVMAVCMTNISLVSLFTDIQLFDEFRSPRLVWGSEVDVAKGMFGVVHCIIYIIVTIAAMLGLCVLMDAISVGVEFALCVYAVICFALALIVKRLVGRYGVKRLGEL